MKKLFLTTVLALGLPAVAYGQSEEYCEAIALHDVPAIENATMIKFINCKVGKKIISEDNGEKQYQSINS